MKFIHIFSWAFNHLLHNKQNKKILSKSCLQNFSEYGKRPIVLYCLSFDAALLFSSDSSWVTLPPLKVYSITAKKLLNLLKLMLTIHLVLRISKQIVFTPKMLPILPYLENVNNN